MVASNHHASWVDTPPLAPAIRHFNSTLLMKMPWLDKIAVPLQKWLTRFYGKPEQPRYRIKDVLNGVWLGHALHPALVSIPLGAWTATVLCDLEWLLDPDHASERAADTTLWVGLIGAAGSAATGVTSWADTDGPERRLGIWHGLLNGSVMVLNLCSALLRLGGQRRLAVPLTAFAFATSLYTAYLGGELTYSAGVNVNHVAWEGGSDDFVAVLDERALLPGKLTRVDAAGIAALLYKNGENIYAIAATCSHMGGPLEKGHCENGVVHCPWHNSGFRLSDGGVVNSPAVCAQPTFAVRVRSGKIYLRRLEHA
jgi:nitrite reductase/ring-hydroxylating ferredoxin subunit/uncharacterized membrane protein